jgi:hypothetical protein
MRSELGLNSVDILVLACFAVAEPLLSVLSNAAGLFIVHGSKAIDVTLLAFGAWAAPGMALIAIEGIAALAGARAMRVAHRIIVSLLVALLLVPVVKRAAAIPGVAAIAIAVAAGAALAIPYLRARSWRWSTVYLTPALVVLPGLMLFHSPVSAMLWPGRVPQALKAKIGTPAPVVLVVFDEFPLASLLKEDGQIDASMYPNFAELAQRGTWYRNATSVSDGTLIAVPAILDGLYPTRTALPDAGGHPNSLFTLLGDTYRMHVVENNTRVCPDALCGGARAPFRLRFKALASDAAVLWLYAILPSDLSGPLPDITQTWAEFTAPPKHPVTLEMWKGFDEMTNWRDRLAEFRGFTDSIEASGWPTLHFLHILLPHAPWEYLPSGQRYPTVGSRIRGLRGSNDRGEDPDRWTGDNSAIAQNYQRHLLQVELVDRLVGRLLKRLRDEGLYEQSLIVITADHGASFRAGESRRNLSVANRGDILPVPLFIKYPNQRTGGIDDRGAQTVDILPTIIDVLDVAKSIWKLDGKSLADPAQNTEIKHAFADSGPRFEFPSGLDALLDSVKYKLRIFGGSGEEAVYRAGDHQGWFGRQVEIAEATGDSGLHYELDRGVYYNRVDLQAPMLATSISGHLRPASKTAPAPRELAVAVNGTVRAVTRTYSADGQESFLAMVPPAALRQGRNEVSVFLLHDDGSKLARLTPGTAHPYDWGTRLFFGNGGSASPYIGMGWSGPEAKITWTDGHTATLYLPVKPPKTDLTLKAKMAAFTRRGQLEAQHVRVLVNHREVSQWLLTADFQECTADVPRDYITGAETTEITFDMPDAVSPASLGGNGDSRTLGLAAFWLEFTPQHGTS